MIDSGRIGKMMVGKKKSQSSIEFLTTYGWAFIITMVIVGALVYFNYVNMNVFGKEYCTFSQQMNCVDQSIAETYTDGVNTFSNPIIAFKVRNEFGQKIRITFINGTTSKFSNCYYDDSGSPVTLPSLMDKGEIETFYCPIIPGDAEGYVQGTRHEILLTMEFNQRTATENLTSHTMTGKIGGKVCRILDISTGAVSDC